MRAPRLYATFLLWMLAELFEELPETGDLPKPKLVFFFDEAHLLFDNASPALVEKVEQVVRLIRSKGVGIYFVTQNPLDIPERILGQLGNRIQHALRAFTPRDQKAVQAAAQTLRVNPAFDAATAITELGVGEALVSFLDAQGRPGVVERAAIFPPASRIGPLTDDERQMWLQTSPLMQTYGSSVDRVSAFEVLKGSPLQVPSRRAPGVLPPPARPAGVGHAPSRTPVDSEAWGQHPAENQPVAPEKGVLDSVGDWLGGERPPARKSSASRETVLEAAAKSAVRSIAGTVGRELGKQLLRGVLGSILGGRR